MRVTGVPASVSAEVRQTMRAPGYGHPAVKEVAKGYGPCRSCLRTFRTGKEERILFTYRPGEEGGTVTAPGPVFVHSEACEVYDGHEFPAELRPLPLLLEARGDQGVVLATARTGGHAVENDIARLFADPRVRYLFVRNAEAGCWMARVDRDHA
jgi:hypothetical protein